MSNRANILFSSFPDFSGNPKAFYEFLNKKYKDKFNLTWVIYNDNILPILKENGINCVLFKSNEYIDLINKINIIFDTHGALFSEKNINQIYINQWHGFGPKKIGYFLDNLSSQDIDYLSEAQNKTDFIIVPSEFSRLIFAASFNVNINRTIPIGFCRDEYILNSDGKFNLQKLTNKNIYDYKKIIFYLPTFRNGLNRNDSKNIFSSNLLNLEKYDEKQLTKFLEEEKYLLVIKKHPSEEDVVSSINHPNILVLNDSVMSKELITIHEIINAADLLISDYSSIYVEYLLLDRPVLFLQKDIDDYLSKRGIVLNNHDIWFPGPMANNLQELITNIGNLLYKTDYFLDERNRFKKLMLSNNTHICQSLFDFLFDSTNFSLKHKPYVSKEEQLKIDLNNSQSQICALNSKVNNLATQNKQLKDEIKLIYNSKSWKLFQVFQNAKSKLNFKQKK